MVSFRPVKKYRFYFRQQDFCFVLFCFAIDWGGFVSLNLIGSTSVFSLAA